MTKIKRKILLIEDNLDDRILIKKFLSLTQFGKWEIAEKVRLSDALETIEEISPDIAILDLSLPDSSGIESFNQLKLNFGGTPIIVLTGLSDEKLAKDLIKYGAQDYLVKGDFDMKLLEKSMIYAIERHKLKLENDRAKEMLLDSVLEAQDQERSRIAKELHDGVVQSLTAVSLNFGLLRSNLSTFDKKTVFHYEKCAENLSMSIDEIRNISHSLMPRVIAEMGLVNSIEAMIADIQNVTDINFDFLTNLETELSEKIKMAIYRIVQELINNAIKHSNSKNVIIQLLEYPEYVSLMVEDDGIGFDKSIVIEEKNCFGLQSIESRVNSLGGSLEVDSKPDKGANIFVSLSKRALASA